MNDELTLLKIAKRNPKKVFNKEMFNHLKKQKLLNVASGFSLLEVRKAFESNLTSPAIRNAILNMTLNPNSKFEYEKKIKEDFNVDSFSFVLDKKGGTYFLSVSSLDNKQLSSTKFENILSEQYLSYPVSSFTNKLNLVKDENINKALKTIHWINNYFSLLAGAVKLIEKFVRSYDPEELFEEDTLRVFSSYFQQVSIKNEKRSPQSAEYLNLIIDLTKIQKLSSEYDDFMGALGVEDSHAEAVNMINDLNNLIRKAANTQIPISERLISPDDFQTFDENTRFLNTETKNTYILHYSLINLSYKFGDLSTNLIKVKLDDDFFSYNKFHWNSNPPKIEFKPLSFDLETQPTGVKNHRKIKDIVRGLKEAAN